MLHRSRLSSCGVVLATAVLSLSLSTHAGELSKPFRAECAGKPIDVEVGHAAPLFADFDGDHVPDLLVGQFKGGQLRIHRDEGSTAEPRFRTFAWLQSAGQVASVPFG